ncbi:urea ABC transporter ATP-binding protein UrtD [Ruminococcus albus]|uniref:urea ABC transporter ATP-binding protein UrtD n=1 Tax=Ruminococcus albus TaxID=1264 RepID=UPI000465707F|nr:urea ABC transporter ATP-binding protein UrtD [Ruminococcus albus]
MNTATAAFRTAPDILTIRGLTVSFSGFKAISDVDLEVKEGEIHVIIGPNGAGKSTLMDLITGKTKATAGEILYRGEEITGKEPGVIASKYHIGRKFQGPNVFDNMTVYENIEIALKGYTSIKDALRYRRKTQQKDKIEEVLRQIDLYDDRERTASELSHGQRQWLEIGMVIAQSPELIILDEPAAGMTDTETFKTGEMIKELAGKHTLIVIEHDMEFVEQIADYVTVLNHGRKLSEGLFSEVKNDPEVIKVYLKDDLDEEGD